MLWSKKRPNLPQVDESAQAPDQAPASSAGPDMDHALDTLADILRTFGAHAFDTDECEAVERSAQCDTWASELLVGFETDDDGKPRRNWPGIRQFMRTSRQAESAYVSRSLGNLRQAIQTFAQCLTSAVHEDRQADAAISQSLNGLLATLSNKDTDLVRDEARSVVSAVEAVMSKRRKREERQMAQLAERLNSLRSELTEAKAAASVDGLTKLSNRPAFDAQMQRLRDLGLLFACPPCLLMLDVDHFKSINDTYGHLGGDAVLQEVAKCLLRTFLRKQDFVARFGGEEFAVLLVDTSERSALELAERARLALKQRPINYGGQQVSVTMSIGVAVLCPGEAGADWVRRADGALYHAKSAGRDRVELADSSPPPSSPLSATRPSIPTSPTANDDGAAGRALPPR